MSDQTEDWWVTPAGGNVFADLGFPPDEAAALKAESTRIITVKQAIKEKLVEYLVHWTAERNLEQVDAANMLGITRSQLVGLLNKETTGLSIDALIGMVARAGGQISLSIL